MQTTIKIQARGVITLPKKIRDKAGLSAGSIVDIEAKDGQVTMRAVSRLDPEVMEDVRKSLEDLRAGRVTPAFSTINEFKAYMKNKRRRSAR